MSFVALACLLVAIDGDTLRCGRERIRLLGIDAPEMPGHCRRGRQCVEGDPYASKAALAAMLKGKATIARRGHDRYGRTLARVRVNGGDLSAHMVRTGMAVWVPALGMTEWVSYPFAEHFSPYSGATPGGFASRPFPPAPAGTDHQASGQEAGWVRRTSQAK